MPWSGHDGDLLAFYRELIGIRDRAPALQSAASFVDVGYDVTGGSTGDVVAFGREADGEAAAVVLNFGDAPARVELSGAVGTRDAFSGQDVAIGRDARTDATVVEVGTLAVLPAAELDGRGRPLATFPDATGDDHGPGSYTYPTNDAFDPGAFDLDGFRIYETTDAYQFEATVAGGLPNPFDLAEGFSHPFLQVYLSDPDATGGSTATREGVNATLAGAHHYRVLVDGEAGARVRDGGGDPVPGAEATLHVDPTRNAIRADVPKRVFEGDLADMAVAPLVVGYDGFADGQVREVGASRTEFGFGGGTAGDTDPAPNVIDLVTSEGTTQAEALAYDLSASGPSATVPYVDVAAGVRRVAFDGRRIARFADAVGDDHGPGSYTYPTNDAFPQGAFDVESVEVYATTERFQVVYSFAGPLTNPFGLPGGFSHPFLQVYLRDPDASGGSRTAREGVGVEFDADYQYRLVANGETGASIERADGSTLTDEVTVRAVEGLDAVVAEFPRSALDLTGMAAAPLVVGYDGFGTGGVRGVNATRGEWTFGGGTDGGDDPKVIDLVTPEGTTNAEALSYAPGDPATVPYVELPDPEFLPRDADGDGVAEDVDGDGRRTYDDVVTLFERAEDPAVRSRPGAFDFNDNGRFDLDDVVTLFENTP
jgi:carbohydrate-binding DOMON domain-containing protein